MTTSKSGRRFQFSVRRLTVVVLVLGLLLAVGVGIRRRGLEFRRRERQHRDAIYYEYDVNYERVNPGRKYLPWEEYYLEREYHTRMAAKYRRAAVRPWLPVEPDPDIGAFWRTLVIPPKPH